MEIFSSGRWIAFITVCIVCSYKLNSQTIESGWYKDEQVIVFQDTTWLSLNGHCPSIRFLPNQSLILRNRTADANEFSNINPLAPIEWMPRWVGFIPSYFSQYTQPENYEVFKGNAVVMSQNAGCNESEIRKHVFIDNKGANRYGGVPIVSINTDPKHLFSADSGIYVAGSGLASSEALEIDSAYVDTVQKQITCYTQPNVSIPYQHLLNGGSWMMVIANDVKEKELFAVSNEFKMRNNGWMLYQITNKSYGEKNPNFNVSPKFHRDDGIPKNFYKKPADIAIFLNYRTIQYPAKIRIGGGFSRWHVQKPFKLIGKLNAPLFGDQPVAEYQELSLTPLSMYFPLDIVLDLSMRKWGMPGYSGFLPMVLFVNGEYWGAYSLREEFDTDFLQAQFELRSSGIAVYEYFPWEDNRYVVKIKGASELTSETGTQLFQQALTGEDIAASVDVQSFIDYLMLDYGFGNSDRYLGNTRLWVSKEDLKFHFATPDLDLVISGMSTMAPFQSDLLMLYKGNNQAEEARLDSSKQFTTHLFHKLLEQEAHRSHFFYRFADLQATALAPQNLTHLFDSVLGAIKPLLDDHVARWKSHITIKNWKQENIPAYRLYFQQRPLAIYGHVMHVFPGVDTVSVKIQSKTLGTNDCGDTRGGSVLWGTMRHFQDYSAPYYYDKNNVNPIRIPLQAIPDKGFLFKCWEDADGTIDTNRCRLIALHEGPQLFRAVFIKDDKWKCRENNDLHFSEVYAQADDSMDYIEIFNPHSFDISLDNYFLQTEMKARKYFLSGLSAPAKSHLVLYASGKAENGSAHLPFKLSRKGEEVYLCNPNMTTISSIRYPELAKEQSYSLCGANWQYSPPTIGESNQCDF